MRIALVELNPYGGLLHYAAQLANALAARQHEVDLIVPTGNELADFAGNARQRPVLPRLVRSKRPASRHGVSYLARRGLVASRITAAVSRVVLDSVRGGYDAVILQWDITLTPIAASTQVLSRVPHRPLLAYVCHNIRPFDRWGGDDVLVTGVRVNRRITSGLKRFDVIFVHGDRSRRDFVETYGEANLVVIPHGNERLFASAPPPPAGEPRILFFGEWVKIKGLPVLMDAFDGLSKRMPSARLTIAGSPAPVDFDDDAVRTWALRHGDAVRVVDRYIEMSEVRDLFATARVVVTPYLFGYQSGVVHLAMTMGRAVVSSDVGDFADVVVDGETGVLVPPRDPVKLSEALERIVGDPALAERLGAAAHRRITTEASWDRVARLVDDALVAASRWRGFR